ASFRCTARPQSRRRARNRTSPSMSRRSRRCCRSFWARREDSSHLRKPPQLPVNRRQNLLEPFRQQKRQLGLARLRDRIEPRQFVVDMSGMAHDQRLFTRRQQVGGEIGGVVALRVEVGKAGKAVVERKAGSFGLGAEAARQTRNGKS